MTWEQPRASILMRPHRQCSYANRTTAEIEYEKEQARIEAKRERYNQIDERMRAMHGPRDAAHVAMRGEVEAAERQFAQEAITGRVVRGQQEKDVDRQVAQVQRERDVALALDAEQKKQRRREEERAVMQANLAAAEEKRRQEKAAKQREQEAERYNAALMASQPRRYR